MNTWSTGLWPDDNSEQEVPLSRAFDDASADHFREHPITDRHGLLRASASVMIVKTLSLTDVTADRFLAACDPGEWERVRSELLRRASCVGADRAVVFPLMRKEPSGKYVVLPALEGGNPTGAEERSILARLGLTVEEARARCHALSEEEQWAPCMLAVEPWRDQ